MEDVKGQLEASIQERIEDDTDFQASLNELSAEEKSQKIDERKSEEFNKELESLKKGSEEATRAKELADNYKTRAEKAEELLKKKGSSTEPSNKGNLSDKDVIYLAKTTIHDDDVDEVLEMAKSRGWDVKKAHEYMKPILSERDEQRNTAAATQSRGGQRGSTKTTPSALLERASRGELPESDEDINALTDARMRDRSKKYQPLGFT